MGQGEEPADSLVSELLAWAASGRAREAASARARERSLADQAAADSTWAGLMVDLAEAKASVVVATPGSQWSGRLVGAGRDFIVLERSGLGPVLIATGSVSRVSRSGAGGRPGGNRTPALDLGLAGAIEALAEDRSPVCIWTAGIPTRGTLVGLARDYVTVLSEGNDHGPTFAPVVAVDAVELR